MPIQKLRPFHYILILIAAFGFVLFIIGFVPLVGNLYWQLNWYSVFVIIGLAFIYVPFMITIINAFIYTHNLKKNRLVHSSTERDDIT
jgi:hypothetical protein